MKLPYLQETRNRQQIIDTFKGYNHNLYIADNEFYDMQNMASDNFPILSPRKPRGSILHTFGGNANGLFAKDKLAWVDGTALYYDGAKVGDVTDTPKTFISMAAYLLVWPDKVYYNTASGKFGSLEAHWTQAATATISQVDNTTKVKIQCTGIGKPFKQWDGVTIAGCSVDSLNKTAIIQDCADDYIQIIGVVDKETTQASGITISREVPDMDFVTENDNRVWGCSNKNHEIYACKLGDPFNWNCYEGISTDSYALTVGSNGDFTAATTHLGYVLFFKEDCLHKVFGARPSNYQITSNNIRGVARGCEKSLALVNETLYYKTRTGIVAFEGSMPYDVGAALGPETYMDAVGGRCGNKYYVSMLDTAGKWQLYVYDTTYQVWHKEDNTHMLQCVYYQGNLYYIDADSLQLRAIYGDSTERVEWFVETGEWIEGSLNKKYISAIQVKAQLAKGSRLEVWLKSDTDFEYRKIKSVQAKDNRTYSIPILPRRGEQFRLRLSGSGDCKVLGISKTIEQGSEL